MAITNYLVHFKTEDTYNDKKSELRDDAVAFVKDATIIHTHKTDYYCGSGPVALKSDLENLDKICFIDLVSELNLDIIDILEGNFSPVSSTAKAGTFQKMLTAIQNNQQIVGIHNTQEDPNFVNLRYESSFVQAGADSIFMYLYKSASIMILTITPQEEVNLTYAGLLTTDQKFNKNKVLISGDGQIVDESDITATELNYLDGVTSNIQTQLNGKASSSHTHTASQLDGFANVAMSGSYTDLSNRPVIPSISVSRSLTSGTKIGTITINGTDTELYAPTNTDTKNTTGTSNNVSKLYLVGGLTQNSAGVITYSNASVYTQSGQLYANKMNSVIGFYETSDARLKNFKDDIKALDVVSEIPTKYFTWKKDEVAENIDPVLHIGTSAQEVQKVYPDLVTKNEEGELSVDYARLSVIALAAIKELKEEINELKAKLQ